MEYTKEELNKTGIYSIVNQLNGKQYIGSTIKSFRQRWRRHKELLKTNKHHSKYLQSSWNKYTEQTFNFTIIEYCELDQCIVREQHYLDLFKASNRDFGYNVCPTAGSQLGRKHSNETKIKIGLGQLGRKHSNETKARISLTNKGRKNSDEFRVKGLVTRKHTEKTKAALRKTYIVTNLNNEEIIVNNLKEFCLINNLIYSSMKQLALNLKRKNRAGWKCRHF